MRMIDADKLHVDRFTDADGLAVSQSQIANAETIVSSSDTNGSVLCKLYPNLKFWIQNGRVVTTIGVAASFDMGWWSAPYRGRT